MSGSEEKSPAFQFYPDAWLSSESIAMMTLSEQGAYVRLLCYDWMKDGIVDDDKRLARLSGLDEGWLNGGSILIRSCFINHPDKEGYLTNPRLQKEREKQRRWREKSVRGGKKSAAKRRQSTTKNHTSQLVDKNEQPNVNSLSLSSSSTLVKEYKHRIGAMLNRRATTKWSNKENKALKMLGKIPEHELSILESYYNAWIADDKDYRRKSVLTLLNNWPGEVDRASNFKPTKTRENVDLDEPEGWQSMWTFKLGNDDFEHEWVNLLREKKIEIKQYIKSITQ